MHLHILSVFVCCLSIALAIDNGLGRTPQMGWNSWYDVGCDPIFTEDFVKERANALVTSGLSRLGYIYVNLDDCWAGTRDENGVISPDPKRFPSGMKALADYVHSLGLKFGVYTDRGNYTCAQRPGSYGFEQIDANTYASWGVDYVKEDSCFGSQDHNTAFEEYGTMRDALNATGRQIFFSLCGWEPWYAPVGNTLGNSWRIYEDDSTWDAVIANINVENTVFKYAGPGGWNDPCLLLGSDFENNPRITEEQSRAQFSMWAVMAAPLLLSQNVGNLSAHQFETYSNVEVINVSQDPLGKSGFRVAGNDLTNMTTNVWARPLFDGSWAVVFINNSPSSTTITCGSSCLSQMGISGTYNVRNLWTHTNEGSRTGSFETRVTGGGSAKMYKFWQD